MRCTDARMVGLAVAVALVAPAAARAEDLPAPKSATPVPVSAATIQLQGEEHFHAEDHETADATGCAPSTVVDASASGSLSSRMTGVATTSWGAALENAKTTGHGSESGTITETKCVVDY